MPRVRRCRQPGCHAMVQLPNHYCTEHFEHEAEYLANRQRWARSNSRAYSHHYNQVTRNRTMDKIEQYQFYRSRQWQVLRRQALDRDYFVCQYCGRPDSKTVDHVVPIEYDPSLKASLDNLATTCSRCHRLKTDWEQDYYGTGQHGELKAIEEIHDVDKIKHMLLDGRERRSQQF